MRDDGVDEGGLAGARRSGEAEHEGMPEIRLQRFEQRRRAGGELLKFGHGGRDGAALAGAQALNKVRNRFELQARARHRRGVAGRVIHARADTHYWA